METVSETYSCPTLPDQFRSVPSDNPLIYFYRSEKDSERGKFNLQQILVCLLIRGNKEIQLAGQSARITPDSFLIVSEGNTLMTERIAGDSGYESILLFFPRSELTRLADHPELQSLSTSAAPETKLAVLTKDPFILHFIQSLQLLRQTGQNLHDELVLSKIREFLHYLCSTSPQVIHALLHQDTPHQDAIHLRQVITANTNYQLTVEELSFLCHMSVSTFKRKFADHFGTTPKKYMTEHRMNRARKLLMERKRPSEIYLELGYEHLSGFSNEFKKHFGLSPKSFQEQF